MKAFIFLKRDVEVLPTDSELPSQKMKMALRSDVEENFKKSPWPSFLKILRRPMPAYQLATAALIIAVLIQIGLMTHSTEEKATAVTSPLASIDTSGPAAENINFL